jgi:ABC-type sugar transport system ATPase subunit
MAGLEQPEKGIIYFNEKKLNGPNDQLIPGHPKIAYLSQYFELRNNYYIHEVLEYANEMTVENATLIYKLCRIEHLLNRWTDELSGGEKQRVAMARLLTTAPDLLLLDEPFSNLDMLHKNIMKDIIQDISTQLQMTCLLVSHDAADVMEWADEIIILKDGKIIQQDHPEKLYHEPVNEYCAGLLGDYELVDADSKIMSQFSSFPKNNKKKILIRPNYFSVSPSIQNESQYEIVNIQFRGIYSLLTIMYQNEQIKVFKGLNHFKKGDYVNIDFDTKKCWSF